MNAEPAASVALHLRDVRIALPRRELIRSLSIDIAPGEIVTVMGTSGSGKSSLLSFIGGHLHAPFTADGEVSIGERRLNGLAPHERRAGILFQDDLLFPHLSVGGNLLFGLPAAVVGRRERCRAIDQALEECGLPGYGRRDPSTLSGGQRARVALMRTLLAAPRILLLDEPFGKLDAALRDDFRRLVFSHAVQRGLPTLLVTHDAADAQAAAGRVLTLE
ncbi:MAG: ATP-binding cassette domain-containing protein [Caldimonas sp.]